MKTTKVLQNKHKRDKYTRSSEHTEYFNKNRVAICNANTLVRSVRNVGIRNSINNFTIKAPDGFPSQKHYPF